MPVGALMRACPSLTPEDSVIRAARMLRECPFGILPVSLDGRIVGVLTEAALVTAFAGGLSPNDPVGGVMGDVVPAIGPYASGAEAMRTMSNLGVAELIVVDAAERPLGVLGASSLYAEGLYVKRPPLVGGMATPFGVYLTTGAIRAGAGGLALVATGASLFLLFAVGLAAADLALRQLPDSLSPAAVAWIESALPLAVFLGGMRLLPISGIHAAEHKVVHAIERGEPLVRDVVRRMPRVHPRCGTNLAVGATLFLGLSQARWIPDETLRLLIAALATLVVWRPLGNVFQTLITTKPPTDEQLDMGIRAGKELLDRYREWGGGPPSLLSRLVCSGIFHVLAGSMLCYALIRGIAALAGFELPVEV